MKYCIDCKHYYRGSLGDWCEYDDDDINPVNGELKPKFAIAVRNDETKCGKDAVWFEQKVTVKKVSIWKRFLK